jgi:hypothetical protein
MPVLLDRRVKRGHDSESWAATRFFQTLESGNDAEGHEAGYGFKSDALANASSSRPSEARAGIAKRQAFQMCYDPGSGCARPG